MCKGYAICYWVVGASGGGCHCEVTQLPGTKLSQPAARGWPVGVVSSGRACQFREELISPIKQSDLCKWCSVMML